jgi:DNA primase
MALLDLPSIRLDHPVGTVAAAVMHLRPKQGELVGCCPFHPDNSPSFYVFADGVRWHCFGCNATGDVLDFVQRYYSLTLREAADRLCNGNLPLVEAPKVTAKAERDNAYALSLWRSAVAIEGTPADTYLRRRGITVDLPPSLRFARLKPPAESGVAVASGRGLLPAMVALVSGPDGEPAGIQRTFLTDDGRKAASADGKVKFSLGLVRGGAIHLGPILQDGLALTEGAEDALSLIQMGAASAWAAAGAGMLAGLQLPSDVRSVVIGGDNDDAGRFAAENAATAMTRRGVVVRVIYPDDGAKDWNESLMGMTA